LTADFEVIEVNCRLACSGSLLQVTNYMLRLISVTINSKSKKMLDTCNIGLFWKQHYIWWWSAEKNHVAYLYSSSTHHHNEQLHFLKKHTRAYYPCAGYCKWSNSYIRHYGYL